MCLCLRPLKRRLNTKLHSRIVFCFILTLAAKLNLYSTVATSPLSLRWMRGSPDHERNAREDNTDIYVARTRWSRRVNSIVACCHSVKLCALAARDFRSQHHQHEACPINRKPYSAQSLSLFEYRCVLMSWLDSRRCHRRVVSRHQSFIYLFYNNIVFPLWFISFGWDHASLKKILKITSPKFFKGFPCHFLQKNYQILNYLHLHGMSISRRLNHFLFIRCPTLLVKNSQIIFHKFKAVFGHIYIRLDTFTFTSFLFRLKF